MEDLTRDFRSSDEEWMQRRQQERQSWRESLNFQPESLNGSGAARSATLGDRIKEGFDKVRGTMQWYFAADVAAYAQYGRKRSPAFREENTVCMSHLPRLTCSSCRTGVDRRLFLRVLIAGGAAGGDHRAGSDQVHSE